MPEAEVIIEGPEPRSYSEDFRIIPVPGHTAGSLCLLLVRNAEALHRSIEQLTNCSFEWVLAGHGGRVWLPQSEMRAAVRELVERRQ